MPEYHVHCGTRPILITFVERFGKGESKRELGDSAEIPCSPSPNDSSNVSVNEREQRNNAGIRWTLLPNDLSNRVDNSLYNPNNWYGVAKKLYGGWGL